MNASTVEIEVIKLVKDNKLTRRIMAAKIVDLEAKLRQQISQSNRYFEIISQRDATIRNLNIKLSALGATNDGSRRDLMAAAAKYSIENSCQTRIYESRVEMFDATTRTWVPVELEA